MTPSPDGHSSHRGTVLVTGASGYIGSTITERLVSAGFRVRGLVRSTDGAARAASHGAIPSAVALNEHDEIRRLADGAIAIIHTASAGPLPEPDIEAMIERASANLECLISVSKSHSIRLLVTSGASIYGDTSENPADEETPIPPGTMFGRLGTLEASLHDDPLVGIIRPSLVYGRGGSKPILASIGPMIADGRLVHAKPGTPISVVHVDDLADLYLRALTAERLPSVMLGASQTLPTDDILVAAARSVGMPESFETVGIRNFWLIKCQRCKEENLSQRII